MKKRILLILGTALLISGVVFAYFVNYELADITALAIAMFGAGLLIASMYNKRDTSKGTWWCILSIALVGLGAFSLGLAGVAEKVVVTIISSVFGLVALVAGLIISYVTSKRIE